MKLKSSVKWTIAAVATVTTVTVSMGGDSKRLHLHF